MKHFYLSALSCILFFTVNSQTLLFGGSNGNGDFENGTSDWVFVNGTQVNKWIVANNATPGFSGSKAVFISGDGVNHQYNTSSSTYTYFYKDVAIPAGTKTLWLVFDYISNGESDTSAFGVEALDALRIWSRATTDQVVAGQELDNVFIGASAGYYGQSAWKKKMVRSVGVGGFAGSSIRLIFQWFNNGTNGNQPPAALDNIEFYASCQEFIAPYLDSDLSATSGTLIWNTVSGATGYQLRYKKLSEPNTVPTYTNPIIINGGNSYFYTLTNLTGGTEYVAEISPIGLSCTEYGAPAYFQTLTPPSNDICAGAITLPVWSSVQAGTVSSFRASTPSALASNCNNGTNNDVWFRFVAAQAQQTIQTNDPLYQQSFYSATNITLFTGDCNNLQPVAHPCATQTLSVYQNGFVSRLVASGLTPGNTYYIRVNTNNNDGYENFAISVYNPMSAPACPDLLQPTQDTILNYGIPYTFKWTKANGADAYRLRIFEESGAYTEVFTRDTSYVFITSPGINYTWMASPHNVLGQSNGCNAETFSTCATVTNNIILSAPDGVEKCLLDSLKIVATGVTGSIQWFRNNVAIEGATADSIWTKEPGNYTVRLKNGSCLSDASNVITISNLAGPLKNHITPNGATTFCDGQSVTLTADFLFNNQWYKNNAPINGSTGISYDAVTSGTYFVRSLQPSTGCMNYSDTITIVVNPTPAKPVINTAVTTFCSGDSSKLTSSALSGNQWYRNDILIAGATDTIYFAKLDGTYTVRSTQGSCTSVVSDGKTIIVNTLPVTPTITLTGSDNFCTGDSAKLTSSATTGVQWKLNGTVISGATNAIYYAKQTGSFSTSTQVNGCVSGTSSATAITVNPVPAKPVIIATGFILNTANGAAGYKWYLNDAVVAGATASQITVLQAGNYKVEITDVKGCKNVSDNFNAVVTGINDVELLGYKISLFPNPVTDYLSINVSAGNTISKKFTATLTDLYGKVLATQTLQDGVNRIPMTQLAQGHYFLSIRNGNTVKTVKLMKNK